MTRKPIIAPHSDYWLLKSEPEVFSWDMLVAKGAKGEAWTGVRNYQARNNMRAMRVGDRGFYYHSGDSKAVVGICEVFTPIHRDPDDDTGTWECVDVRALAPLPRPVSLDTIKAVPALADMVLVKNSRLSVQPVTAAEWAEICRMGGLDAGSAGKGRARSKRA